MGDSPSTYGQRLRNAALRETARRIARSAAARIAGQLRRPSGRITWLAGMRVSSSRADRTLLALGLRKITAI